MKKLLFVLLPLLLVAGFGYSLLKPASAAEDHRRVTVERGTVVRQAQAVGRIEAAFEVPVVAENGGVLMRRFAELGQRVERGEPLVEVRPLLTDLQRFNAERALLAAREGEETVEEMHTGETVQGRMLRFFQGSGAMDRMQTGAERSRAEAEAQIRLLLDGEAEIEGHRLDFLVRSPIDGHLIDVPVEIGAPVVPSSSYGTGTVLMTIADLDHPLFRGTVAESDVGLLREGMPVTLLAGALPGEEMHGVLQEISLRARSVNNATVFDIKVQVTPPAHLTLRSGYSATATIEVDRAEDVLLLPERLVEFRDDGAFVLVEDAAGEVVERAVVTGLSDAMTIEIRSGLEPGAVVLERL
ncbi:MAG: efflux RND transporter periplasmic adaptor subunit [Planctomycetes bacterium]|nr:efflux RND transporter periplasmic adaptor subunit [Planctomycetota bacterium]